eukprot:s8000_g4.t1
MVPDRSESVTEQDLLLQDGNDRAPAEMDHEAPEATGESPRKSARIDPDAPATEPSTKQMRISAVHHMIAGAIPACKWLASIVGVDEVVGKDGTKIEVDVNAEEGEFDQEMRLSEPLLWESEFPPEAERRGTMNEPMLPHRLSRHGPVTVEVSAALTAMDCQWPGQLDDRDELDANDESGTTVPYKRELACRMAIRSLGKGECDLVNVYDWLCLPMPLAMRLYNNGIDLNSSKGTVVDLPSKLPLSALRKTVQWANQGVFEEAECDAPIAFIVFRRTKATAMRRWVAGGPGGNARVKLAKYFNRQFTDHISTFEWDNTGLDNWRWRMESESFDTVGIVRVPMTDPICLGTPRALLTLNEIMDWQMHATNNSGESLLEWRLMGHTMVPLPMILSQL